MSRCTCDDDDGLHDRCPIHSQGHDIEAIVTKIFHGDYPRCECCGERDSRCRWRPAYQMMMCPRCPKRFPHP